MTHFNINVGDMGISGLSVSEGLTRESSKTKTSIIIISFVAVDVERLKIAKKIISPIPMS